MSLEGKKKEEKGETALGIHHESAMSEINSKHVPTSYVPPNVAEGQTG